jgi:hypothetical protein
MTISITVFSIVTLGKKILRIKVLIATHIINWHSALRIIMLRVTWLSKAFFYCYAECHSAECHGARIDELLLAEVAEK